MAAASVSGFVLLPPSADRCLGGWPVMARLFDDIALAAALERIETAEGEEYQEIRERLQRIMKKGVDGPRLPQKS